MEQPAPAHGSVNNYTHLHANAQPQDALFNAPAATAAVPLARGRQARDPQAKTLSYTVASLDDFEVSLREYLNRPRDEPDDNTDCQLSFWIGTSFLVAAPQDAQPQQAQQQNNHQHHQQQPHFDASQAYNNNNNNNANGIHAQQQQQQQYGTAAYQSVSDPAMALSLDLQQPRPSSSSAAANGTATGTNAKKNEPKMAMSILEALQPTADPKEKMRKQRAIAKACVDAIQRCDGYRYSFHNCWNSREDDSFRFSYYCNDSLLNKDRAANGKGAKLGKRATKPVYDCKGVLSIKFSATKETLDVFYKHLPIHKTYEERAPPPRKDSRRRKFLEENDPEALKKMAGRPKKPDLPELGAASRPKKKKKTDDPKSSTSIENDLRAQSLRSLLELIVHDPATEPSPPEAPPAPPPAVVPQRPPPVAPPVPAQQPSQAQPRTQTQSQMQTQTQTQTQTQSQSHSVNRRRPRNSCDVCKTKKTKCDGTRPVCHTCIDKKRQCFYSTDMSTEDQHPLTVPDVAETAQQAQAATSGLSELELIKKELDEAKARIQELEDEKRRTSITPSRTPQMAQVSKPTRPQPQHQSQAPETPSHAQTHTQQRKHQRQHSRSHSHSHHQQSTAQQQQQQQQLQMQTPQTIHSPQQAMQQLQTAAQQLQPQAYNYAQNPYSMTAPQSMPRNAAHASQQPHNHTHTHTHNHQLGAAGMAPSAADAANPYSREYSAWPANPYYGYQNATQQQQQQQQQQENQWTAAARNSGVFR